jgi:hypothetical protein
MLRPTPTCLSLSPQDISSHLQQIDMYHGLLKQGFKKNDVIRYLRDHQTANSLQRATSDSTESEVECAPSTVDLMLKASPPEKPSSSPHSRASSKDFDKDKDNLLEEFQKTELSPSDISLPTAHRHAPRQSSLLRFAKAVSPSPSVPSDDANTINSLPGVPARTYRPRTDTYSYVESEFSEADLEGGVRRLHIGSSLEDTTISSVISRQRSVSPMRAEAEVFVPQSQQKLEHKQCQSSQSGSQVDDTRPGSSPLVSANQLSLIIFQPRRSSLSASGEDTSLLAQRFPSSPPSPSSQSQEDSLSALPPPPLTPTPARVLHSALTEPRRHTPQYLDGSSFVVYNDALPSQDQPQTPAELARHQIVTEHEAAYTAPVGVMRTPLRLRQSEETEPGEQSPTQRMMGLRERRARELMRSVRAEGLRLERIRRLDRQRLDRDVTERPTSTVRGIDGEEDFRTNEQDAIQDGPGPALEEEQWRDDLEIDRVGDENWEGDVAEIGGRTGIRVLSGNANGARGRGWWNREGDQT